MNMRFVKKCFIALCLLSSLLFSQIVYGAESFIFKDDFSGYTESTYTGYNVSMGDSWRTANEAEVIEKYSALPIEYGNGCLKINTNTDSVGEKYTTVRSKNFPTAVLTAKKDNLSASQRISMKVRKSHGSDMWGVRFYVHNSSQNKLNYYTLFFGGMYTRSYDTSKVPESEYLTWGLYKSVDETIVTLKEKVRHNIGTENDVDGYMGDGTASLEIEVANNEIVWNLTYEKSGKTYSYSDSYIDENMFKISGADTTVHLYAAGSTNSTRYIYFDDFEIETKWKAPKYSELGGTVDTERENNVIFVNSAEKTEPDDNGIIDFGAEYAVDEIYCDGTEIPDTVLVSKDKSKWYKLAGRDDFTSNEFLNNVTTEKYRYVYAGETVENLRFLRKADSLALELDEHAVIYPRVDGVNYFSNPESVVTTDDNSIAVLEGNTVKAKEIGTVNIIAEKGMQRAVLEISLYSKNFVYSEPNFAAYRCILPNVNAANGIHTLKDSEKIFRVVASNVVDRLKVYASDDNIKWYKIADFKTDGEQLNNLYGGAYKYVKAVGYGNAEILGQLSGMNIHLLPGKTFKVYSYADGLRVNAPLVCENKYALINDNEIRLLSNMKEISVSVFSSEDIQSFVLSSRPVDAEVCIEYNGKDADVTLYDESLHDESAFVQIMKYNIDKSLRSISFKGVVFSNGRTVVNIENINEIGTYTAIRVINESFMPLTNTITIN